MSPFLLDKTLASLGISLHLGLIAFIHLGDCMICQVRTSLSQPRIFCKSMATTEKLDDSVVGLSDVLSLPPKWVNSYGDFITKNASAVAQIESGLRSITYIIPGTSIRSQMALIHH